MYELTLKQNAAARVLLYLNSLCTSNAGHFENKPLNYVRYIKTREAAVRKGVRQCSKLSPLLVNIYTEQAINECKEHSTGIKVNGVRIQRLRFADDIAIIAQGEINLKRALESLDDILKSNYKMKINRKKQKLCSAAKTLKILILTLRRLMSYIYGGPILDVSRSHTTTQHSR